MPITLQVRGYCSIEQVSWSKNKQVGEFVAIVPCWDVITEFAKPVCKPINHVKLKGKMCMNYDYPTLDNELWHPENVSPEARSQKWVEVILRNKIGQQIGIVSSSRFYRFFVPADEAIWQVHPNNPYPRWRSSDRRKAFESGT